MAKKSTHTPRKQDTTATGNDSTEKWLPWALATFAFMLFSLGFYSAPPVMLDRAATLGNPAVTNFEFFSTFNLGMYAPLTWLGYAIAFFLGPEGTFWYHLLSAGVHAFNVVLVFRLMRLLGGNTTNAGLVAFFFGTHAIQVEAVTWIAAFSTPLFSMFSLLSMIYYVRHCSDERKSANYWKSLIMFLLACLSKSQAVALPLTLLVLDILKKREINRKTLLEKAPFVLIALAFGALTFVSRRYAGPLDQPADFSIADRFLMACQTVVFYIGKILVPVGLSIWYPFEKANGAWHWSYYAAPLILAGALYLAWFKRKEMPLVWTGLLFFLVNIALVLPWATFGSFELRADRYNYLACLGVFSMLTALPAYLAEKRPGWADNARGLLYILGAFWLLCAGVRLRKWTDTVELIESAMASNGDNFGKGKIYRGIIYADQGKGDPALKDFDDALNKNPLLYEAYKYRGNIMGLRKNYELSVADLSKYIEQNPNAAAEIYNRGLSYVNLGKDTEAMADFNRCLEIDPNFRRAYRARGNTYLKMGETEKGNADLKKYEEMKGVK